MKFFSKPHSNKLLWVFTILMLLICLFFQWQIHRQGQQILRQEVSKSPAVQAAKIELPEQAVAKEVEWQWSKLVKEQKCAAYKKKVYSSNIDPQLKDLLWGAVVVASEYCWEVDVPPPSPTKPTGKPGKPKAQRLQ